MNRAVVYGVLIGVFVLPSRIGAQESTYLRLSRAIELFGTIVREINEQYVEPIDPDELVNQAIEQMLAKLDPYTEFYRQEQTAELDFLLQGRYIGVGIRLGTIDSALTVIGVTHGTSAHREGVRVGDVLLEVDSLQVLPSIANQVRKYLRGAAGTPVRLRLLRGNDTLTITLRREEILVQNVSYAGFLAGGIGLIRLERFSRRAPEEFRLALDSLRAKEPLRGLIIDLRDNPGGLLDAAVSIAEMFLRTGDTIVVTKNRNGSNERAYIARSVPYVDTALPIIVIVNSRSASASEILAGALQDNDRAVIIGDTTVGKGLVQTVVSLPYNAALKLTTARYYTPSGRSIQQVQHWCPDCWIHRGRDAEVIRVFSTRRYHRPIQSGGGIVPDVVLEIVERDSIPEAIGRTRLWQFATHYTSRLRMPPASVNRAQLVAAFLRYLDTTNNEPASLIEKVHTLRAQAKSERWGQRTVQSLDQLQQLLRTERTRLVVEHANIIGEVLEQEIWSRFWSDRERVQYILPRDPVVYIAADMLRTAKYRNYLVTTHGNER